MLPALGPKTLLVPGRYTHLVAPAFAPMCDMAGMWWLSLFMEETRRRETRLVLAYSTQTGCWCLKGDALEDETEEIWRTYAVGEQFSLLWVGWEFPLKD